MLSQARLDERFLDRRGCGDELYGDADQKASLWLAGLQGAASLGGFDANDADFDDYSEH
jgi:hypothetical protein